MKKYLFSSLIVFTLIGCGGGGDSYPNISDDNSGSSSSVIRYPSSTKEFDITSSNQVEKILKTGNSTITLNVAEKKDIYLVVTSHQDDQDISIDSSIDSSSSFPSLKTLNMPKSTTAHFITPDFVIKARSKSPKNFINSTKSTINKRVIYNLRETNINDNQDFEINTFKLVGDDLIEYNETISATARSVVKDSNKNITLVVWVQDSIYNEDMQKKADNIAKAFLQTGEDNDIYDWVTNVYGKEWGDNASEKYSNLIGYNGYIDILIDDMKTDKIAGYFYSKDNYKKSTFKDSNEKIMFYINSRIYDRDNYSNEENEKEVFTTLAHEFQHMINFYQRLVLKGKEDSVWFNEFMSETTEDLVAIKIGYKGPRNVDPNDGSAGDSGNTKGRYPAFNKCNTVSLTNWGNECEVRGEYLPIDYSKVSAFGAYLLRNYNGAKVLHDIMYSNYTDEKAILDATGESDFKKLVANWATAVVLSDQTNISDKLAYNFGDFKYVDYNDITYELGSINFFNYIPSPTFQSSATIDNNANLYYHLGEVEGSATINVTIPNGADITIIAK